MEQASASALAKRQETALERSQDDVEGSKRGGAKSGTLPKKLGRPSVYSDEIVSKIERGLMQGKPVEIAVKSAGVAMTTYARWLQEKSDFRYRIEAAKQHINWESRRVLRNAIRKDKDVSVAQWWLERKDPEFTPQAQGNVAVQVNVGYDGKGDNPSVDSKDVIDQ